MTNVNPIPTGFHTVTPHLVIKGAAKALDFYKKAFGAKENMRMPMPDGRIMHAQIQIGDSPVMIADEFPEWGCSNSPASVGNTTVCIHIYVPDVDAFVSKAQGAGATVEMPVREMFWGDRYGKLKDPFGHEWSVATRVKSPTPQEMQAAMASMCGG